MDEHLSSKFDIKIISPDQDQCFFGYYDLNAYDPTDRYHLFNRTKFINRLPNEDDVLELGVIDLQSGEASIFAETTAWNFQQGAMLQWLGNSVDTVLYNIRNKEGNYNAVVHNIKTGAKKVLNMPSACVSPDGRYSLSINFSRIYDFRPGYGYAGKRDENYNIGSPENDGIFLTDIKTGKSKLLISYGDILKEFKLSGLENEKYVINHITFNTDSNRFLFLLRNFPTANTDWKTSLITSDLNGNMHMLMKNTYVSHYNWKNNKEIVAHCSRKDKKGLFVIEDLTGKYSEIKSPFFDVDIHCIYSPDRRYIIGDGYPLDSDSRPLFIYDTQTEKTELLMRVKTIKPDNNDIRCDLHARWNRKGSKISFDSTHRGKRDICEIDFR